MVRTTLTIDDFEAWQEWFDRLDDPGPYHSPSYLEILADNFEYPSEYAELFIYGDEDAFVYYPYLRRPTSDLPFADRAVDEPGVYSDVVASWYYGGPLCSPNTDGELASKFAEEFADYCQEVGIVSEFLRFDPNLENHERFDMLDPTCNRQTVPVDLTKSKEDIWNGYESRNQRAIKQGRDSDIVIDRNFTESDIESFHSIYTNAMEARDASQHYRFQYSFFQELIDEGICTLVIARCQGSVIGGFLIAYDNKSAHHYLSASNPDFWDKRVNNLMYHEAVMYMHDTGRHLFDFQGGRPGVFKFKKGFSPDRGEFYLGRRIHLQDVYKDLVESADEHGIKTDASYFPAYRRKQSN